MKTLIRHGTVIDPSRNLQQPQDLLIEEGIICQQGPDLPSDNADNIVDAQGQWVTPGLVDVHTHLRDPGFEYKEDIISGTRAAAAGGFTRLSCMPNTYPLHDSQALTRYMVEKARSQGFAHLHPVGCITRGQKGQALTEMGDMLEAGCCAFSDDGLPVDNGDVLRRAMEYASGFDALIVTHSEDQGLAGTGVMNEGWLATEMGLTGIPWVTESAAVAREVMLAEFTGARLHICHISCGQTLDVIKAAKARGVQVTCEVTPHHFTLTEEAVRGYDTNAKMGPPLRSEEDRRLLQQGLADGSIDLIASDHAPHHIDDKNLEFNLAANGLVGLETSLGLTLRLVDEGLLTPLRAIELLSTAPCRTWRLPGGSLENGSIADITVIDPQKPWTVDPQQFYSKARNTPFSGWQLPGKATVTMCQGVITHQE